MEESDFEKLAKLCRIECTEAEKKNFIDSIGKILKYVEQLDEIPTDGIEPCFTVLETTHNVMREDAVGETLPRDVFLANAPAHVGGMVRVPPVLKE
jgi:aspartyl-tRNA(Asn)/glutamyl-tRNA(Gln) amidotransferase subunit C